MTRWWIEEKQFTSSDSGFGTFKQAKLLVKLEVVKPTEEKQIQLASDCQLSQPGESLKPINVFGIGTLEQFLLKAMLS